MCENCEKLWLLRAQHYRSTIYFLFWKNNNFLHSHWISEILHVRNRYDIWHTMRPSAMQKYDVWRNKWFYWGLVFVDFGQRCDLIFDTNTANYEVPGRRWVDIHLMRMPSTGYRFDVEPSSLVYWMKCLHSRCRFKIDRISFRLKLSGFGAKNDEKSSISEKLMDGFSCNIV